MDRYRITTLALLLCTLACAMAKRTYPKAEIKVSYNYHEKFLRGSDGIIEKDVPFLLLANPTKSKFFSPKTERKDSLKSTPSGRAQEDRLLHAAIMKYTETKDRSVMDNVVYNTQLYVFKDIADGEYTVYDYVSVVGRQYYTEPIESIKWEITDSTRNILGYDCIMAIADYHGRHWTAWFTPDIPLMDGPWKLCGLPGLILEASESTRQHVFTANGIEKTDMEMRPIYNKREYEKTTRIKMLQQKRQTKEHSSSMMRAELDLDVGPDYIPTEEEAKMDFIETDYR